MESPFVGGVEGSLLGHFVGSEEGWIIGGDVMGYSVGSDVKAMDGLAAGEIVR